MHAAPVTPAGDLLRWVELPGDPALPARVYLHGLGASSPAYFAATAAHPLLAGPRSLLVDLLGFGLSDRPTDFPYTLEAHADAVATALRAAGVGAAELIGHSMGGAVAIVLAHRHPALVAKLVLADANLDPVTPAKRPGSSGIATFTEAEFLAGGWREVRELVGPHWWSTMRLAGRTALHRSAVRLAQGTTPTMRELLLGLRIPRAFLYPAADGTAGLPGPGVELVAIPDAGHNLMLDNPQAFARAVAGALGAGPRAAAD
ncbi:alpha/beta fold hydrolase [Kitasatospora sp. NBC_01287]|uniref:alpha/beta fold hydrolase n=1 Tax=Kitasatospora sp. NBC_01287 TaxID=2903573 RepID=UPI002258F234|nr:alpha/beta hydrolase [Kitasatospora sp. NBC_01287]MCX4749594.1 alpha/beta fold hydrolase [Kitasatospora sp. NBC_01287]